jgi:hypothetical protein
MRTSLAVTFVALLSQGFAIATEGDTTPTGRSTSGAPSGPPAAIVMMRTELSQPVVVETSQILGLRALVRTLT